jgi:hypothetical protein
MVDSQLGAGPAGSGADTNFYAQGTNMPCPGTNTHAAAITAAQSASIVRDLGVPGAISLATASLLGIRQRRLVAGTGSSASERPRSEHAAPSPLR